MNEFEKLAAARQLIEKNAFLVGPAMGAIKAITKPVMSYATKHPGKAAMNALGAGFIGYEVGQAFGSGAAATNQGRNMGMDVGPQTM